MDDGKTQIKDFSYSLTSDLNLDFSIKILSLEGSRPKRPFKELLEDPFLRFSGSQITDNPEYYLTVQLFADNKPLTVAYKTSYKSLTGNSIGWNEWITIPIKYKDLPLNTQIAITIWDLYAPRKPVAVGGTTVSVFGKNFTLRKGKQKLFVWLEQEADGRVESSTPGKMVGEPTEMDRLEKLIKKYERGDLSHVDWLDKLVFREIEKIHKKETDNTKATHLFVDLPKFDSPLVFNEKEYILPVPKPSVISSSSPQMLNEVVGELVTVYDPEVMRENPVEGKHRKLARSHRTGAIDRNLKPNAKIRDELNVILKYPPTQVLTPEEKDLLWKFRFYLSRDKKALTKFLKCVVWSDATESKQAVDLLPIWADIDVDDALELLGPDFKNREVRGYAVNQLRKADDDELQLYLLQLVQALKFEESITDPNLLGFNLNGNGSSLLEFLISRAAKNPTLGNFFNWYLLVETSDKVYGPMYINVRDTFIKIVTETSDGYHRRDILLRQDELIKKLSGISSELKYSKDARPKKIERLRDIISDPKNGLVSFPPLPLPLDSEVIVTGLVPDKASIFKSNLMPLRLTFSTLKGSEYPVIFKSGDDLRQDQLVIQIITLMDKLLRKENLDLKLSPYRVLSTGVDQGLVQYIPSLPLATVLAENNGSLLPFLRKHNADDSPSSVFGIAGNVMDNYVKSCAGYCVITYLLGVGDRHLDNLLLTPKGHLFHIDFGFILGHDPKPFPPPMKLCKEMVEAMGGANSPHYTKFKSYCYIAFNILRKSANLILNLFALMVDANVPDVALEPDKAVMKVQEKFRLDLTEEEAIQYFQALINESVSALFPQVIETIHKWAQYWRK